MSEIERAIKEFEDNAYHTSMKPTISEASKAVALRILRAELSRQENGPLTREELYSMKGKPIYVTFMDGIPAKWFIAGSGDVDMETFSINYGNTWLAYRYEPKGEATT